MSISDYAFIFFGVLFICFVSIQLYRDFDSRKVRCCLDIICVGECPECRSQLDRDAVASATQRRMRFFGAGDRRLRGPDYPSRLISIQCPGCAAKLEFRLDGSLWACNSMVGAQQER